MKAWTSANIHGCLVVMFSKTGPVKDEWAEYLASVKRYSETAPQIRVISISHGWVPDPGQRQMLEQSLGATYDRAKISIITGSTYVRGVFMAIKRLHPTYRIFGPESIDDALRYVDLPPQYFDEMKQQIAVMNVEVGAAQLE
jgi:hypothetical protein